MCVNSGIAPFALLATGGPAPLITSIMIGTTRGIWAVALVGLSSFDRPLAKQDLNFLLQQTACDSNPFKTNFWELGSWHFEFRVLQTVCQKMIVGDNADTILMSRMKDGLQKNEYSTEWFGLDCSLEWVAPARRTHIYVRSLVIRV